MNDQEARAKKILEELRKLDPDGTQTRCIVTADSPARPRVWNAYVKYLNDVLKEENK